MKCDKIEGDKDHQYKVVKALQDMFELVTNDMMVDSRYWCLRICCPLSNYYASVFNLLTEFVQNIGYDPDSPTK